MMRSLRHTWSVGHAGCRISPQLIYTTTDANERVTTLCCTLLRERLRARPRMRTGSVPMLLHEFKSAGPDLTVADHVITLVGGEEKKRVCFGEGSR